MVVAKRAIRSSPCEMVGREFQYRLNLTFTQSHPFSFCIFLRVLLQPHSNFLLLPKIGKNAGNTVFKLNSVRQANARLHVNLQRCTYEDLGLIQQIKYCWGENDAVHEFSPIIWEAGATNGGRTEHPNSGEQQYLVQRLFNDFLLV